MIKHLDDPNEQEKKIREMIVKDTAIITDRLSKILDYVQNGELEALAVDKNTGEKSIIRMTKVTISNEEFAAQMQQRQESVRQERGATVFQSPGFERHGGGSVI